MATMLEPTTTTTPEPIHQAQSAPPVDLTGRAVLIRCSISCWSGTVKDRALADEAMRAHGEDARRAKRLPRFIVPEGEIKPVQALAAEVRSYHYSKTLNWKKGEQVCIASTVLEYTQGMRQRIAAFEAAYQGFLSRYPALVAAERDAAERARARGESPLFKEDDYPTPEALRAKFGAAFDIEPLPVTHWILDEANEEFRAIAREYNDAQQARIQEAQRDAWERLAAPLRHMAATLADPNKRFKNSLVDNLTEIVEGVGALNLTADPELDNIAREIRREILEAGRPTLDGSRQLDAQTLRDDATTRATIADRAAEIADKMADLF